MFRLNVYIIINSVNKYTKVLRNVVIKYVLTKIK